MMKEERDARIRREQDFYNRVAEILHVEYNYIVPFFKKTRWNARCLGNGRFPGYGVIRMYNNKVIHVMINHPIRVSKFFDSPEAVYGFLQELVKD